MITTAITMNNDNYIITLMMITITLTVIMVIVVAREIVRSIEC